MEIKVVKKNEKTLVIETPEETSTLTNLLRENLWQDKNVSEAAHIKEHPYLSNPKILVTTSRGSPQTALEKAAERISDQAKEFKEEFKKALKK